MQKSHILLVEGTNDERLFKAFLIKNGLDKIITATPPKGIGWNYDGKQGVITFLPELLKQLNDGSIQRLGLIIDCDVHADGGGRDRTLDQISEKLNDFKYDKSATAITSGGFIFKNNDGLPDLGVWIMPDNKSEGTSENWISHIIHRKQKNLFDHASKTVQQLTTPLFNSHKIDKAKVATWLSWQDRPGEGLFYSIEGDLVDNSHSLYTGLLKWINKVFIS